MEPSEKIDKYIAGIQDFRGPVLAAIRRVMLAADSAVIEEWKWMGSPVWSCDGMIAVANAHKGKVKVTFSKGAHYADADGLFNNGLDGKEWRAIDIAEGDTVSEAALSRLVKTAISFNRTKLEGKKKAKAAAPKATSPAKKTAAKKTAAKKTAARKTTARTKAAR